MELYSWGSNYQKVITDSGNGLAPKQLLLSLPTYICVTQPQKVNRLGFGDAYMCDFSLVQVIGLSFMMPPGHKINIDIQNQKDSMARYLDMFP